MYKKKKSVGDANYSTRWSVCVCVRRACVYLCVGICVLAKKKPAVFWPTHTHMMVTIRDQWRRCLVASFGFWAMLSLTLIRSQSLSTIYLGRSHRTALTTWTVWNVWVCFGGQQSESKYKMFPLICHGCCWRSIAQIRRADQICLRFIKQIVKCQFIQTRF